MKDGGLGIAGGRRLLSVSNLLVVFEMALCIVLLAGAGLMIRSTVNLYGAPIGVNTAAVLTMRVNLPEAKYASPGDQVNFHRASKSRLDSLAGVEASGVASNLPLGNWLLFSYELEGTATELGRSPQIGAIVTSPDYFQVMRVKPTRGRIFQESDGVVGLPVALVNESFAAKYWPDENPLGKRLRLMKDHMAQPWLTVVGILPDILQDGRRPLDHDPLIYLPYAEEPQQEIFIVAKTHVTPSTLVEAFRRAVQNIDPNLPVYDVRTLENRLEQNRLSVRVSGVCSRFLLRLL
jgi:putative ABC transport system permease protein